MMTLSFNQIAIMLVFMIFYIILLYILIYRKFKRFILQQQYMHEQAVVSAYEHHEKSSLENSDGLEV